MTAYPTVTQNAFLADEIGQQILRAGKDYQTIPYPEFYALVETHTGKTKFNENDLKQAFRESVLGGRMPFLISFGTNVVFVCKDSNFAPVAL